MTPKAPAKQKESSSVPLRERLRLNDNQRWVICFTLFFISAFITLAIGSHYFSWRETQMGEVANAGGQLGSMIANFLVGEGFGAFSLCIPLIGFVAAVALCRRENYRLLKLVKVLLLLMIIGSITLGFLFGDKGDVFGSGVGGRVGLDVVEWLVAKIGSSGVGLLLCMVWIMLALYINSTKTIEVLSLLVRKVGSIFKRRERDEEEYEDDEEEYAEDDEEESDRVLPADDTQEYDEEYDQQGEEYDSYERESQMGAAYEEFQVVGDAEQEYDDEEEVPPVPWVEDDTLEIIVPTEEEFVVVDESEEPAEPAEPTATESAMPSLEDSEFVEIDSNGEIVGVVPTRAATPSRSVTPRGAAMDNDFEIVENGTDGMRYVSGGATAEEMVIGTGGIVETTEDGTMHVVQSEHNEEEGKMGSLYDPTKELAKFKSPSVEILEKYDDGGVQFSTEEINENKVLIQQTLDSFGVKIKKITATVGPTVTLYEIEPEMGVKVARIKSLEDDIAISLKAMSIRLIVPMPGRGTIGIEIPNRTRRTVSMHSVIRSKKFQESKAALPVVIGKTIQNETFVFDLAEMPHMIVAGATGQGKSVGLNAIITSLLYKKHPAELKFVMVDPKKVELSLYSRLEKHYLAKMESEDDAILTDTQKVVYTLNSLCGEMEERYKLLRAAGVKRIDAYNQKFLERKLHPKNGHRYLPYLVVVIDEFADMIMTAGKEVETPIVRLGQLARAIGIHLIIATQRPDAKVITGLISANCPARMAFKVTNRINSQIILGGTGAEKLTGKGDMLMQINGAETRLQCAFLDTPEIERVIDFISRQRGYSSAYLLPDYVPEDGGAGEPKEDVGDLDNMFEEIARFVVANQQGSTSFIQRRFKIGYNRAGRIMDQLEAYGIVGKSEGSKPREVLINDPASLEKLLNDIFIENL